MSAVHLTQWGSEGPRVVMVHGSAQGSSVGGDTHFANQQGLAARGWHIVVPDRPGHGRSADPGRPDDAEADGEWAADLLDGGAHLVGHSFGGAVALAAASRRPELVRSLTLIEPAMQGIAMDDAAVRRFVLRIVGVRMLSFSATTRARRFATLLGIPPEIRGGSNDAEFQRMGRGIARLKVPARADILRELDIIRAAAIPLLVVTGGWNAAFEAVGRKVAALGGGTHVVVPSPHHFPQAVGTDFNDRLDALMRDAEGRLHAPS